jgi:hypothetical protein
MLLITKINMMEVSRMAREPKPDFERYMTALHCQEPGRVPLGDWHVNQLPIENFMGKTITSLQDQIDL